MSDVVYKKEIRTAYHADVIVIGGGPAGFCAAIAAAKTGARTMIIEKTGMLGGTATAGLVGPFMTSYDMRGEVQLIRGVFDELMWRMDEVGAAVHPSKVRNKTPYSSFHDPGHDHCGPFDSEGMKRVMDQMTVEYGIDVLFHTSYVDSIMDGRRISQIIVHNKEGLQGAEAKVYVDCSGDADVAVGSGMATIEGDDESDNMMMPGSMFFEVVNVDKDLFYPYMEANQHKIGLASQAGPLRWLIEEKRRTGEWTIARNHLCTFLTPNNFTFKINVTRVFVDATDAVSLSKGEMEGRRQVVTAHEFLKKFVPGFADSYISTTSCSLGIRETRHVLGEYTITVDDLLQSRRFDDEVLRCSNAVDIHDARSGNTTYEIIDPYYSIPYRSLVPKDSENLLVAGRCLSAQSKAASAIRVMPCCAGFGHAAGTAAALCAIQGVRPMQVDVKELQTVLKEQGAYID